MKTIAVVKLNRGAWDDFKDKLIAKFRAEGTLDTYSDDFVRTRDTVYVVKLIKIDPYMLDPLIGHEGHADASDLLRFLTSITDRVKKDYLSESVTADRDVARETATIPTPAPEGPKVDDPPVNTADAGFQTQSEGASDAKSGDSSPASPEDGGNTGSPAPEGK